MTRFSNRQKDCRQAGLFRRQSKRRRTQTTCSSSVHLLLNYLYAVSMCISLDDVHCFVSNRECAHMSSTCGHPRFRIFMVEHLQSYASIASIAATQRLTRGARSTAIGAHSFLWNARQHLQLLWYVGLILLFQLAGQVVGYRMALAQFPS